MSFPNSPPPFEARPLVNQSDFPFVERIAGSGLLGTISLLAFASQLLPLLRRGPRSPFRLLCLARCAAQLATSTALLFYCAPVMASGLITYPNIFTGSIGFIYNAVCMLIWLLEPIMALNRWIALNSFKHYEIVFSRRNTKVVILFSFIACPLLMGLCFWSMGCVSWFDPKAYAFMYRPAGCFSKISSMMQYVILPIFFATTIINIATFTQLAARSYKLHKSGARENSRSNWGKFIQTCLQQGIWVLQILCCSSFLVMGLNNGYWFKFFCLTLSIAIAHAVDGCVLAYFFRSPKTKVVPTKHSLPSHA